MLNSKRRKVGTGNSSELGESGTFDHGVWVIKEGEPLPIMGNARLMRTGLLAESLALRGVFTRWWTSRFQHATKRHLEHPGQNMPVSANLVLEVLEAGIAYSKNTSVKRLVYHWQLGRQLRARMQHMPEPSVIYCAFPSIDLAYEAARYASRRGVPLVIDVRDLWPEIFARGVPMPLRWLAVGPLKFLEHRARQALRQATLVTAITQSAMDWVDRKGVVPFDRQIVVPLGAPEPPKDGYALSRAAQAWEALGVTADTWNICFFGTLSSTTMDLETAIDAVKGLVRHHPSIRLVICGTGDNYAKLEEMANGCSNILLPGWVDWFSIHALMNISKVALYPLRNLVDMRDTISNKLLEYLSGSLPVIVCPSGAAKELIETYEAGTWYKEGDVGSLTKALKFMLDNESTREQMAANAYACYKKDYRAELSSERLISVLEQAVRLHRDT